EPSTLVDTSTTTIVDCTGFGGDESDAGAAQDAVQHAAEQVRTALTEDTAQVAVIVGDPDTNPVAAAVAGLLRSVHAEYSGRVVLVERVAGTTTATVEAAIGCGEPQVRATPQGLLLPRLRRGGVVAGQAAGLGAVRGRTVFVTGSAAGLGGIVARH